MTCSRSPAELTVRICTPAMASVRTTSRASASSVPTSERFDATLAAALALAASPLRRAAGGRLGDRGEPSLLEPGDGHVAERHHPPLLTRDLLQHVAELPPLAGSRRPLDGELAARCQLVLRRGERGPGPGHRVRGQPAQPDGDG